MSMLKGSLYTIDLNVSDQFRQNYVKMMQVVKDLKNKPYKLV